MAFTKVYPFTTEKLASYFPAMNLENKSILTVGSSGDQVFNALVCGAGKITVFDINPNTSNFYKLKRERILSVPRKKLVTNILDVDSIAFVGDKYDERRITSFNNYLQNDSAYQFLRERLEDADVSFIEGDIFKMKEALGDEKFDRIFLSNILYYIECFFPDTDPYSVLGEGFEEWKSHLNDEGVLQLLYLYGHSIDKIKSNEVLKRFKKKSTFPSAVYDVIKVHETLGVDLDITDFKGVHDSSFERDSIVTYTKK